MTLPDRMERFFEDHPNIPLTHGPSYPDRAVPGHPTTVPAEVKFDADEGDEDPPDEDTLALISALEELVDQYMDDGATARAWNPSAHPRGPGGKFRSTVDRIKDALDDHLKNGRKGDPFDAFDREQLRKAAKARGISLRRGEDRDSIAAKLLADLKKAAGTQKSPVGVPAPAPATATVHSPTAQRALDAAHRIHPKAQSPGHQLLVYGALRKSSYDKLAPADQQLILADLSAVAADHRLDPRMRAKAQKVADRFTPAGTPAGSIPKQAVLPPATAVKGQTRFPDAGGRPGLLKKSKNPGVSGDGWTTLPDGSRGPWGKYGAAGLLLRHRGSDGVDRFLMVQRGPGISDPGKWQFPGGAIDSNETPFEGATREVLEELGFKPSDLATGLVHGYHESAVPGGWKYTSIAATVPTQVKPDLSTHHARMETADAKWMTLDEIEALDKQGTLLKPLAKGELKKNVVSLFPADIGKVKAKAKKPAVTHKPSRGRDLLTDKAAIDKLRQDVKHARTKYDGKTADGRLAAIGAMQGYDDTPTVVSKAEMDRLLATGDYIEAWRGVRGATSWSGKGKTAAQMHEDMRSGPAYYGKGIFGNGYYLATRRSVAQQYSDGSPGSVMRILIPKAALVEPHSAVMAASHKISSPRSKAKGVGFEDGTLYDEGRYAAAKGLDGILIDHTARSPGGTSTHVATPGSPAYNWLNRSVLIVQEA